MKTFLSIIKGKVLGYFMLKMSRDESPFVCDLGKGCVKYGRKYEVFRKAYVEYRDCLKGINDNLYLLLNDSDKELFIRFFLKRFFDVNTINKEEVDYINRSFDEVRKIYETGHDGYLEFMFRGIKIKYMKKRELIKDESKDESILMNYFDVAHAFFLIEYEMDGYNPKDGQTILDCGAAYGDTLILFRCLYPNSRIISFEAVEDNIQVIKENVLLNNIRNVDLIQGYLYKDSNEHVLNSETWKINDTLSGVTTKKITTIALDDIVDQNGIKDVGLIKFDIEGAEQEALLGSVRTIKRYKPLLYIPIYHLRSDIYMIPEFLRKLNMPMEFKLKWTEKKVWGVDCVLFVRFV